ncbi:hypothetical protein ALC53_12005 [Atta colombica]|uniref:ISXO2-like transposase domain-containing protein n=1 Tax=Atta colombica TaxID=520822 RepID=A0A195AZ80_9HYME|nr:hypothetical protein ALC53_12005 [Atta colombica]
MQDNARPHTTANTREFLMENSIRLLPHPAMSPDLNLIEYIWDIMVHRLRNFRKHRTDSVRVSKFKIVFEKDYTLNWSMEVFKIIKVQQTNSVTYLLKDSRREPIQFIAYFLLMSPRHKLLMNELELDSRTVINWTNFCRELFQQWITKEQKQIDGENKIVKLDEAKIGKRKSFRWNRDIHNVFIVPVSNRNTETILPIIRQYVAPGNIIHIDKWHAYDALQNENYTHLTVNLKILKIILKILSIL